MTKRQAFGQPRTQAFGYSYQSNINEIMTVLYSALKSEFLSPQNIVGARGIFWNTLAVYATSYL